jgi:hypothetical protein
MRRSLAPPIVLVALAVIAVHPACGFPDPSYSADDGGPADATAEATPGEASTSDTSSQGDGPSAVDGGVDGMATSPDASFDAPADVVDDTHSVDTVDAAHDAATNPPDAGHDAGNPCDVDGDGYLAEGACGGNDCCDTDSRAHPNQPNTWFTLTQGPDACGNWKFDCGMTVVEQFAVNFTCGGTGLTGCTGGPGFMGADPGCGGSGEFYNCNPNGALTCKAVLSGTEPQGCH